MAEEQPTIHIDSDWKKQAQEEKRKLAEQEAKKAAAAPPAQSAQRGPSGRPVRTLPEPGIPTLVNAVLTQTMFYLGDLARAGGEGAVNLDMAKHQLDTLNVLAEKTKGNLTEDEQRVLDTAMYEGQMRFINVASQYI